MSNISKQKTESGWRQNDRQTAEDQAADAERAPGGAGLFCGHCRAGDFGQMLLGRPAGGPGYGGNLNDFTAAGADGSGGVGGIYFAQD